MRIHGLLLAPMVFCACLIGIISRPHFDLAAFWPANAIMVGMLIRFPNINGPLAWISGAAGFLLADAVTGAPLIMNVALNATNMASIVTAYYLLRRLGARTGDFGNTQFLFGFFGSVLAASLVAGACGAIANPLLLDDTPLQGFLFWFTSDWMNYVALLPIFLTLPSRAEWRRTARRLLVRPLDRRYLPALTLIASSIIGVIVGGPGAVAIPIPALLWCALTYTLFGTAILTFAFVVWTQLAIQYGLGLDAEQLEARSVIISVRLGVIMAAITPLVIGGITQAREKLVRQLKYLADHDAATGLQNRRAFLAAARAVLMDANAHEQPVAVMMLDIDNFKSINDTHGHDAGDRVIEAMAGLLTEHAPANAIIGRMGGEEFSLVLQGYETADALAVAENLTSMLRATPTRLPNGETVGVTASIGIQTALRPSLEEMLKGADRALYAAKAAGRDRCIVAGHVLSA